MPPIHLRKTNAFGHHVQATCKLEWRQNLGNAYLTLLCSKARQIMAESAQQATMALTAQEVKAYASLLAVNADDQRHIM